MGLTMPLVTVTLTAGTRVEASADRRRTRRRSRRSVVRRIGSVGGGEDELGAEPGNLETVGVFADDGILMHPTACRQTHESLQRWI